MKFTIIFSLLINYTCILLGDNVEHPFGFPYLELEDKNTTTIVLTNDTDYKINKNTFIFKKGSHIVFYRNGVIKYASSLLNPVNIQIYANIFILKPETGLVFYQDGKIAEWNLKNDVQVKYQDKTIIFTHSLEKQFPIQHDIAFYNNGKIRYGFLKKNTFLKIAINEIAIDKGLIAFYNNKFNTIAQAILKDKQNFKIKNKNILLYNQIDFYPNGSIQHSFLAKNTIFTMKDFFLPIKKKCAIGFYENGNLFYGDLNEDIRITINKFPIELEKNQSISFYKNGELRHGYLKKDLNILVGKYEITFHNGFNIKFYPNGIIAEGTLGKNLRIQENRIEKTYNKWDRLYFSDQGVISKSNTFY